MEKKTTYEYASKRNFLKVALAATAALTAGIFLPKKLLKANPENKIKLLTADGKLIEVDQSKINFKSGKTKVSDKEIKNWMQTDKTNKPL